MPNQALAAANCQSAAAAATPMSRRTVDAFVWRFLAESSKLVLQIGVQITLARLLPVEAFGVLAVASLVVNLGLRVSEIGTGPALIQRAAITATHIRVAFTLSVACGLAATVGIWLAAPVAAAVFKVDAAAPVLRLIGLVFAIGSIGTTAESLLLRRMDYRRLLWIELLSYACGFALVGIGLALLNYGVWALAWATVAQAVLKSVLLLVMSPHPARPSLAGTETKQLLNFGIGMTLGRLASFAAQNADYFVVARWLGTTALGWYSRAYQLMCLPIYQFSSILNSVLFPAYSSIQTDAERLRRGYLGSVCLSAIVVFPALTTMAIVTPELLTAVFGPQWAPASSALQILCLAGSFYCIYNLADSLVRAVGAVYEKFLYQTVYALAVLCGAFIGTRWGIGGVSAGLVGATILGYLLMAHLSLRLTHTGWRPFFLAQLPGCVVAGAAAALGLPAATVLRAAGLDPLVVLGATMSACGIAALGATFALPSGWLDATLSAAISTVRNYALHMIGTARRTCSREAI